MDLSTNSTQILQHWSERLEHLSATVWAEYTTIALVCAALLVYSIFFVIYRTRFPQRVKKAAREGKQKLEQTKESAKEKFGEMSDKIKGKSSSGKYHEEDRDSQEDGDEHNDRKNRHFDQKNQKPHRNISTPFEDIALRKFQTLRHKSKSGDAVWLATWKHQVVVKDFKIESTQDLHNELQMINQLQHPNLITVFKAVWKDIGSTLGDTKINRKYRLIMEMGFCNLQDIVERYRKSERTLTLRSILRIFSQVADAMSFLHSKGIIHGNLKLSNLIVFDCEDMDKMNKRQFTIKLADAGMGTLLENGIHPKNFDKEILPPEVGASRTDGWALPVDVYEFGNILWQLIRIPEDFHNYFSSGSFHKTLEWQDEGNMFMKHAQEIEFMHQNPHIIGPEKCILLDHLSACWQIEPERRPSFEGLRKWSSIAFPLLDSLEQIVIEDRSEFLRWKTLNRAEKKINISNIRAASNEMNKYKSSSMPLFDMNKKDRTESHEQVTESFDQSVVSHPDEIRPRETAADTTATSAQETIHVQLPQQQKTIEIEVLHEQNQAHLA